VTAAWRRAILGLVLCTAAACTGQAVTGSPGPSSTPPSPAPSGTSTTPPPSQEPDRPPNILIVLTDDQRADTLGVMPQVRRIFGRGGIQYANGFDTTPLCCPSRATIMTGRFPHDTGVLGNGDALKLDHDTTVQRYLHDAGYRTGMVGKFLNDWPVGTAPPNFDRWALFNSGYLGTTFDVDGRVRTVNEYSTTFIGDQAVRFLRDFSARPDRPWFLYVATSAPHDPWIPDATYANAPVPPFVKDPAMRETDTSDKPQWVRDSLHLTDEKIELDRAQQLRTLMSVDDMVGRVYRTLRRLGQDRDTLAFFLSDNGFLWGEHGLAGARGEVETEPVRTLTGKRFPYLPSVRTPLLARWPGHFRPGRVVQTPVTTADLAPTILDAAGVALPTDPPMDGHSLGTAGDAVIDADGTREDRTGAYLEYHRDPIYPSVPSWSSIVSPSAQYVEWFGPDGKVIFREYYDLAADPFQLTNLLADGTATDDPDTRALDQQIARGLTCSGTTGPTACP